MRTHLLIFMLLLGFSFRAQAVPPGLESEPPPAPSRHLSLVDEYALRASQLFQSGQYEQAVDELRKAYQLEPKPLLLFNMAQVWRRANQYKRALKRYEEFLQADPQSPMRAETEGYMRDMKRLIEEKEQAERAKEALAEEQKRAKQAEEEKRRLREQEQRTQAALAVETQRADQAEREKKKPVYKRGWFWGLMTLAAAAGVGVGLAVYFTQQPPTTNGGIVDLHF